MSARARARPTWGRVAGLGRVRSAVLAGDRRVWRVAGLCAVPLLLLICLEGTRSRAYNLGTNSVGVLGYVAPVPAHQPLCVRGLEIPAGTARLRLRVRASTRSRPRLRLALYLPGRVARSELGPSKVRRGHQSVAVFPIPQLPDRPAATPGALCVNADAPVAWGGTALAGLRADAAPTVGGVPIAARVAVWYQPRTGARRSYFSEAGVIIARAALFRGGLHPWLYVVVLLIVLPVLALVAVRWLALAAGGRAPRRLAAWLAVLAALNFACWALITPSFQSPDEVDHFAYVQSLAERGQAPSRDSRSRLSRWSGAETLALEGSSFLTDYRSFDSRPPWLSVQERSYVAQARRLRPSARDGGGYETAANHGPIYYAVLAPAYFIASSSPFSQLLLMRFVSAALASLTVLFTFLLARELIPGRLWLAVLAALLVAYQPVYGFISGIVNNDVGINAAAAALEFLLIRMLRRGITVPLGVLTGALLFALPSIKGTGLSLYPIAALVLLAVLWRRHSPADLRGFAALAVSAVLVAELSTRLLGGLRPVSANVGASAITTNASAASQALHNIPDFLSYVWQVFLPKLPFMTAHFPGSANPAFNIFVVHGWADFGLYTVSFPHWLDVVILIVMLGAIPCWALAAVREWRWVRSHLLELAVLVAMPVAVIVGFEAAYYTPGRRPMIAEVGRYVFPAIGPLAVLVVGGLHAFGRRHMLAVGAGLLTAMIALSYVSQLLTLTAFYA